MATFDKQRPYVFISYTKKDKDLVYPFVKKMRENGANVWMDDLLGRKASSWLTDVLPIVVDVNRVLTLYFRSENSLVNQNVVEEVQKSIRVGGDKSVHIVDLYPHENNAEIYTKLYRQTETIQTFSIMQNCIAEEANAYLYNDDSDFAELMDYITELGVIIHEKAEVSEVDTPVVEVSVIGTSTAESQKAIKRHTAVNVKQDGERTVPAIETYATKITRSMTLREFEELFTDDTFVFYLRTLRACGGRAYSKQIMDYLMAVLLRGCDKKAEINTARWKYCALAVASKVDLDNLTLGASQFTWQSNSRKAVQIDGSGKLGENNDIFEKLSSDMTIGEIEQKFIAGEKGFATKDNEQIQNALTALLS